MNNKIKPVVNPETSNKNAISFLLKIKRGISWSTRRVEIDRERFRYFKPEDGELRFSEKIDDCLLVEKNLNDPKKYFILLTSKTNSFNEVKISCEDVATLKKLKEEFDRIIHYKTAMASLQNKTFVIETEGDVKDNKTNYRKETTAESVHQSVIGDPSTLNRDMRSVYNEDISSNFEVNKRKSQFTMNEDIIFNRKRESHNLVMSKNLEKVKLERFNTIKTKIEEETEPVKMSEMVVENCDNDYNTYTKNILETLPDLTKTKEGSHENKTLIDDVKRIDINRSEILKTNENTENSKGFKWEPLKYSKHSLIEFGCDQCNQGKDSTSSDNSEKLKKNFLSVLTSCSNEHMARHEILKDQISLLNSSYNNIKQNQIQSIILILIVLTLSSSLIFKENTLDIIIVSTVITVLLTLYSKTQKENLIKIKDENIEEEFTNEIKNSHDLTYVKVSSIFQENSKNISNYITNIKSFSEWNRYIFAINNYNKEDNSASYFYQNSFKHTLENSATEIKIKRKLIQIKHQNNNITIHEKSEIHGVRNIRTKIYSIETSSNNPNKSKVSIVIPLKTLIEHNIPLTYLKSAIDSLDLLQLNIANKNFNQDLTGEVFPSEINTIRQTITNNESNFTKKLSHKDTLPSNNFKKKDSINTIDTHILNSQPNTGINQSQSNGLRMSNTFSDMEIEFKEVDNKFSISQPNKKIPEETETNPDDLDIISQAQTKHKDSLVAKQPRAIDFEQQKENDEIHLILDEKLKSFDEFLNKEWKVMEDKPDYKSFYFDEKSGFRSIKSESIVDKNIKPLFEYLIDLKRRNNYDKNFDSGHTIRQVSEYITLNYLKYKGKFTVSPRDFTIATHVKYTDDECVILGTSYNSEKYPKVKGIERADLIYGGFILKRLEDFKTHFTFFSLSDLKLAKFLVNTSLKEVAMCAKHFRDLFK